MKLSWNLLELSVAKCCKGQSLVEVVVAVGASSILLVSLLSLISLSLRNSRLAKDRARAVALGQEGVELMRSLRDYNWSEFLSLANGNLYNLPETWTVETGLVDACLAQKQIYNFFWRCVSLSMTSPTQIEVNVAVTWKEGSQEFTTNQTTQMSLWER